MPNDDKNLEDIKAETIAADAEPVNKKNKKSGKKPDKIEPRISEDSGTAAGEEEEVDNQSIILDGEATEPSDPDPSPPNSEATKPVDETAGQESPKKKSVLGAIPPMPRVSVPTDTIAKVSVSNLEAGAESWIEKLPQAFQPFARLARFDKPVGTFLLALPCWIGLVFARIQTGISIWDPLWFLLLGIGAFLMRSAGCVWNDITDRKIDAEVERTKNRPLPAGDVTLTQAIGFLGVLLFFAFVIWLALPSLAKIVAAAALPLVLAYPFMKVITWWPQAWLGLTFSWGVLLSAAIAGYFSIWTVTLYLAMVCWVLAYDTIYAMQDTEDDALIGVRSTARLFGEYATLGALGFHTLAALLLGLAAWGHGAGLYGLLLLVLFALHGLWQAWRVDSSKGEEALEAFKSNVHIGSVAFLILLVAAIWEAITGFFTALWGG